MATLAYIDIEDGSTAAIQAIPAQMTDENWEVIPGSVELITDQIVDSTGEIESLGEFHSLKNAIEYIEASYSSGLPWNLRWADE